MSQIEQNKPSRKARAGRGTWRRGTAVLETALVILVLAYLSFGTVEFGYYFYVKNALEGAAREGARAGIPPSAVSSDVTTAVTNSMTGFSSTSYSVSVTDTSGNTVDVSSVSTGSPVKVTVSATWSTIGAGFRPMTLISGTKTVKGVCVMRKEG